MTEHLVSEICRAAQGDHGDTEAVVRAQAHRLAPLVVGAARERLVRAAVARLEGLGALDALLHDGAVDEVLVNPRGDVWVECDGTARRAAQLDPGDLDVVLERILAPLGRRLDRTSPIVDARLADGSRVCAVIPPVALDGAVLSVRRFRDRALPLGAFAPPEVAAVVDDLVERRANVVVSGPTSSGKTSLLNSVLGRVPPGERLVVVEDTAELLPHHDHLVRLEARPPTPDGLPAVTLADLVRAAMRLRPDRLVVGEVRGPEVVGLMQALNTGHDGSWSTCHANSALDALHRLETLVIQAAPAWPLAAVRRHLGRSVDAVVHVARTAGAARRIVEIAEVREPEGDGPLLLRPVADDACVVGALARRRR
jgi:pilus assembly protein CpaF